MSAPEKPFCLETARLRLIPLGADQLCAGRWRLAPIVKSLGADMGLCGFAEWWQRRRIYSAKLSLLRLNPRAWLFGTTWMILDTTENLLAGEIGFKGPPAAGHAVELGYSTRKDMRGRGIMSEAVSAMVDYAFSQHDYRVDIVTAFTKHANKASQRVLQKNGFIVKPSYSPYMYWERAR